MATVILYAWQRRDILYKLGGELTSKINKIDSEIQKIPVIQPIYEAQTTESERNAVEVLGDRWLNKTKQAYVIIKTEAGNSYTWYTYFENRPAPHGFDCGRPPNVLRPGMVNYAEVAELVDRRAAILAEKKALLDTISTLLQNATTLNKVRDLWPSVTEYLDQDTIAQLNAPSIKKTRVKRDPLILPDEAKASLIKLNLTRSSK